MICRQLTPQESVGQLGFTHLDFIQVGSLGLGCRLDGFISGCGLGLFREKANSDCMLETASLTCFLL